VKLQQLRYLCGIADQGLNLSKAAEALYTSQPGISRQIRLLEEELGIDVLVRQGNRIAALTEPGRHVVEIARRVLRDIESLRSVGEDFANENSGALVVATTHVHARYLLLPVVRAFNKRFPNVRLSLRQGNPDQIVELVNAGTADIGLCSVPTLETPLLTRLPCYEVPRCVLVPSGHPLLRKRRLRLADLASYPMITLDRSFASGVAVMSAFSEQSIEPNVILSATDADVIKAYVAAGVGIATVPEVAFDSTKDRSLRAINARHLFAPTISYVWVHRNQYLRGFAYEFIRMLSSKWTRSTVERVMQSGEAPDASMTIVPLAHKSSA